MFRESFLKKLPKYTTMIVIVLLVIYYIFVLLMNNNIVKQVKYIQEHPFPVRAVAGELKADFIVLKELSEHLSYDHSLPLVEHTQQQFNSIDESVRKNIDFIDLKYISQPKAGENLREKYTSLRAKQVRFLQLCRDADVNDTDIEKFFQEEIKPEIEQLLVLNNLIISSSRDKFDSYVALVLDFYKLMIFFSTIMIFCVLTVLGIYLKIDNKKNKRAEEVSTTLRQILKNAENANAAKSMFLTNMSHDMRTPMNAIIGMTAIASMNIGNSTKVRDCLDKINTASKHLLELINDILDMSKIESGKMILNNEAFSLAELISSLTDIIKLQIQTKGLKFKIYTSNLINEAVIGDRLRINQILLNIVGNAIKFTPRGGQIDILISELPSKQINYATYRFVISDNGIGMEAEFLEKIFEPFERAQNSTKSKEIGTGLGMAITKNIVDMMKGQIVVSSSLNKGTTVEVVLNLKLQANKIEDFDLSMFQGQNWLIIDNDPKICENITKMLAEVGIKSEWVLNGMEAVEKITEEHGNGYDYDAVIVAWKMSGMDGIETSRQIRKIMGEDILIAILTAYDWTEIADEAKNIGINIFLERPLFRSHLYNAMYNIISDKQKMKQNQLESVLLEKTTLDERILLVEDNELNMEIAEEFIKICGADVEKAWDGSEAVKMVKAAPEDYYSLIFMDIQMPIMDGYEATRQIRQFEQEHGYKRIPIVAMSANAFSEDVSKAYLAGMDDYITKPMSLKEVQKVLDSMEDKGETGKADF